MSLILDALRKSEGQRQRHAGPGLASVPEAGERRGPPPWTLVLGALLVANVVLVLALFLTRNGEAPPPAPTVQARPAEQEPAPPARAPARTAQRVTLPPPTRADRQEVRPLAAEIPPQEAAAEPATDSAPAQASAPRPQPVGTTPPPRRRPASSTQATDDARLPRMSEMVVRGELNVPDMHVDIHVYSGNPAERFVFINMRKYKEGDDTREGPRIERITESGVVMQYDGRRFVLPKD